MKCPKCGDERAEAFSPRFHTCPTCDAAPAPSLESGWSFAAEPWRLEF